LLVLLHLQYACDIIGDNKFYLNRRIEFWLKLLLQKIPVKVVDFAFVLVLKTYLLFPKKKPTKPVTSLRKFKTMVA